MSLKQKPEDAMAPVADSTLPPEAFATQQGMQAQPNTVGLRAMAAAPQSSATPAVAARQPAVAAVRPATMSMADFIKSRQAQNADLQQRTLLASARQGINVEGAARTAGLTGMADYQNAVAQGRPFAQRSDFNQPRSANDQAMARAQSLADIAGSRAFQSGEAEKARTASMAETEAERKGAASLAALAGERSMAELKVKTAGELEQEKIRAQAEGNLLQAKMIEQEQALRSKEEIAGAKGATARDTLQAKAIQSKVDGYRKAATEAFNSIRTAKKESDKEMYRARAMEQQALADAAQSELDAYIQSV